MSILNFDPNNIHSMLWWVAQNASDDPSWRDTPEWKSIDNWRIKTQYGLYVSAIQRLPDVFQYAFNEQSPIKHITNDQLRLLEDWYKTYILPIKEWEKQ